MAQTLDGHFGPRNGGPDGAAYRDVESARPAPGLRAWFRRIEGMTTGNAPSPGGRSARARTFKPKPKNPSTCPTCGAVKGRPCISVASGKTRELRRLHRTPPPPKHPKTRAGYVRQAFEDAQDLGPIIKVNPSRLRVDRSPRLEPGLVYATYTGTLYHPAWCIVVATKWDNDPDGLVLIAESTVGRRKECAACEEPLTD